MPVLHTAMSEKDMDQMPRMKDCLKAEDLNTDACVTLAAEILKGAANELAAAARRAAALPNRDNMSHLKTCRDFYESELFTALSCGIIDGKLAAKKIIKDALSGKKVPGGGDFL